MDRIGCLFSPSIKQTRGLHVYAEDYKTRDHADRTSETDSTEDDYSGSTCRLEK